MYFDYTIGLLGGGEIKNGSQKADLLILPNFEDQNLRPLDYGLDIAAEIGVRAGYIGLSYRNGWKNLALKESGQTIKTTGAAAIFLGYRFSTDVGKKDANRVKKMVPNDYQA